MASVQSLGVHKPSALPFLISEGILSADPPESAYTWQTFSHKEKDTKWVEDELVYTTYCVVWSRGGVVQHIFRFDVEKEAITHATFTSFATPHASPQIERHKEAVGGSETALDAKGQLKIKKNRAPLRPESQNDTDIYTSTGPPESEKQPNHRALVVILKTQAHVYLVSHTSHIVHLPFVIDSVFPSFRGIILQRKITEQTFPQPTPMVPPPPQNTFSYSQSSATNLGGSSSALSDATKAAKSENRLDAFGDVTLVNEKEHPNAHFAPLLDILQSTSAKLATPELPRLFCLVDPLGDIGTVVTRAKAATGSVLEARNSATSEYANVDPNERLLYFSPENEVGQDDKHSTNKSPLTLAVTENYLEQTTTLYVVTYVDQKFEKNSDFQPLRSSKYNTSRRRSSFVSRLSTGATTPVPRSHRQASKDPVLDEGSSQMNVDLFNSVFDQPEVPAKSSRRVSSLLARADLSSNHDKLTFTDLASAHPGPRTTRRGSSFGTRTSQSAQDHETGTKPIRSRQTHDLKSSHDSVSFHEPPMKNMLDELDEIHDISALDDPGPNLDTHGLKREIIFKKIFNVSHQGRLQAALSEFSPNATPVVFTMRVPGLDPSNPSRSGVLILCVMNRSAGELLIFQLKYSPSRPISLRRLPSVPDHADYTITVTGTRRSGIVDACKISEGFTDRMLVLDGNGTILTLQAPWTTLLKIELPKPLSLNDPYQVLQHESPRQNREGGFKRVISEGPKGFKSLAHVSRQGRVDIVDFAGVKHRLAIQLRPSNPFVSQIIGICQAVLPASETDGEVVLRGWWDTMSWLRSTNEDVVDKEWTAVVIVLFVMGVPFVDENHPETPLRQKKRRGGLLRSSSGAKTDLDSWDELCRQESIMSATSPEWMEHDAWKWIKREHAVTPSLSQKSKTSSIANSAAAVPVPKKSSQIFHCITLARAFIKTPSGQAAIGRQGYMPVAASRDPDMRRTALATMLVALHLLREELKLNTLSSHFLHLLAPVLIQMGTWLRWPNWSFNKTSFYMLESVNMDASLFDESVITGMKIPAEPFPPPSILKHLESTMVTGNVQPFINLLDVVGSPSTDVGSPGDASRSPLLHLTPRTTMITSLLKEQFQRPMSDRISRMDASGLEASMLETLPEGIAVTFRAAMSACQAQPLGTWNSKVLNLIGRDDIARLADDRTQACNGNRMLHTPGIQIPRDIHSICNQALETEGIGPYDGSAEIDRQSITRLLFNEDQRFAEAAKMVHPLHYPIAQCMSEPGWSETDLLKAQQEVAKIVALRTLSVSLGRGLLFYGARLPLLTEKFPVHGFTLSCVMKPSETTVTADRAVFTEEKVSWAFFHAGVEAGLSISREAKGIDTSWILFNKPRDLTNRHAGFLLALGLNGHLKSIAKWVAFKYLTPKHNMTSIGLLLGLSASYIGTMDTLITRLLSVHVTRMLPPGAAELNLSPLTQTCGIMGIGLLYCDTQHRRMTEIMLSEMENVDIEDSANPLDTLRDEGYRLAAGFALGYVNLGRGKDMKGLRDMHITERLLTLAIATKRVDQVHIADKATAGSTLSIALIFMKSNDEALARKIDVPDTTHQFDYVRPDQFLLRTVAKQLIMWDGIKAEHAWITGQLPTVYEHKVMTKIRSLTSEDLPFFNILAGLCLSIGLKYAGTGDLDVRDLLCTYLDQNIRICRLPAMSYDSQLARITIRNCQDIIALSASCVMAGRGDVIILRRLRLLHGRTDAETPYGSHLAAHFAIGILFLGGGTHTFGTSNLAIASLLCAFYPLFPASVLDNKSHLQAFRHFWVLAVERRCLIPRDIDTYRPLTLPVVINHKTGVTSQLVAPCLLPELSTITTIQTADPEYWPITLDLASNKSHISAFHRHQSIYLRRRNAYDMSQASAFSASIQAMNDTQTAHQLRNQPFDWLFHLPSLSGFDRTERALVLPADAARTRSSLFSGVRGTVLDDRLMVEAGCLGYPRSERLWNLRLLLKWAEEAESRGEGLGWFGKEMVESLRARLVLWAKEGSDQQ